MSTLEKPQKPKTRWGCLAAPIAFTLLFAVARIHDEWYERQPLSVHLRDVFKESGFEVPEYVTEIEGFKGVPDFHGDYGADVSFVVRPEDVEKFMKLPKCWQKPEDFQPTKREHNCGRFDVPTGSYMIWERPKSDYGCQYGVDPRTRRIYFSRWST